jgi:hypothetical protein
MSALVFGEGMAKAEQTFTFRRLHFLVARLAGSWERETGAAETYRHPVLDLR